MNFEFATAARIIFGRGKVKELSALAKTFGQRAAIVTGRTPERADDLRASLKAAGIDSVVIAGDGEPTVDFVRESCLTARSCSLVIGFGGGSAIDGAKAIAAVAANSGEPLDYLEIIGQGRPLEHPSLPFIAVPTTAGTGAEVTKNAVLDSRKDGVKASLRGAGLFAKIALIDPELTLGLPQSVTASSGLDALTQLIEAYVSSKATCMTDLLCLEGLGKAAWALRKSHDHPDDLTAREAMSWASLLSGLALTNAGLGVVHGFASPLGGLLQAPHGELCAAVLPHAMRVNIEALRRKPDLEHLKRLQRVAGILTGENTTEPEEGSRWVMQMAQDFGIPTLSEQGLKPEHMDGVIAKATNASSMKGNPVELTYEELRNILGSA